MGSDPRTAYPADDDESPRHEVTVAPFAIGRTQVRNDEYARFVAATGHRAPGSWQEGRVPARQENLPVTYVSWHDAAAFCAWAGGRLPTEAEWEAATGGDGRLWPWGDVPPGAGRAVHGRGIGGPESVGRHPDGASPCGALDLAGNVSEWVASAYRSYPFDAEDGREEPGSPGLRVVRGGSYIDVAGSIRCTARQALLPEAIDTYVGFRLAADPGVRCEGIELVDVPGGRIAIGRDPVVPGGPALPDEVPRTTIAVAAFELARTPVTNRQYAAFVAASGHRPPPHWRGPQPPLELEAHPVTFVDHDDAVAFCAWAGGRLPTEAEWEKAARGTNDSLYPWGDDEPAADGQLVTNCHKAVFGRGAKGGSPADVGSCPAGASPYGHLDLAGNVWEWVSSAYRPYPYRDDDGRELPGLREERVLRGGSFRSPVVHLRCAARSRSHPTRLAQHIGFRVARTPTTETEEPR